LPVAVWSQRGIAILAPLINTVVVLPFTLIIIPLSVLIDIVVLTGVGGVDLLCSVGNAVIVFVMTSLRYFSLVIPLFWRLNPGGCFVVSITALSAICFYSRLKMSFRVLAITMIIIMVSGITAHTVYEKANSNVMTIHFPRVGQADAAIIATSETYILVDSGPPGKNTFAAPVTGGLKLFGVRGIDAVFLTHEHPDHSGGMFEIAANWPVRNIIITKTPGMKMLVDRFRHKFPDSSRFLVRKVSKGDVIDVNGVRFDVVGPNVKHEDAADPNATSMQLVMSWKGWKFLFTGDAPWEQVQGVLERLDRIDLIKLPHHGSGRGFPPPGLKKELIRLKRSGGLRIICPSQLPDRGNLPSAAVVDWFRKNGFNILYTGVPGGVVVEYRN
jgi:competence protein ComEC